MSVKLTWNKKYHIKKINTKNSVERNPNFYLSESGGAKFKSIK